MLSLSGCALLRSKVNDLKGSLSGNSYDIYSYDHFGNEVLHMSGEKIDMESNTVETTSYVSDGELITGYDD